MNLIKIYSRFKNDIRERFDNNPKRMTYNAIKKALPELIYTYETRHNMFRFKDILYCIINGIDDIPKCKMCNNYVQIKNFNAGFRKCCCEKCRKLYEKTNEHSQAQSIKNKGVNTKQNHKNDYMFSEYQYTYRGAVKLDNGKRDTVRYTLHDYCKHGDVDVYLDNAIVLNEKRKDHEGGYCLACNKELFETYIPTIEEQNEILSTYKDFYKNNRFAMDRDFWIRYYPKTFKVLILYYKEHCDNDFIITYDNVDKEYSRIIQEANYCILNDLKERPLCPYPGCTNHRSFYNIQEGYLSFCEEHKHQTHVSAQELDLYNYLISIGEHPERNTRSVINGNELDFYFPELNKAIEYNGVWFHSLKVKPEGYHINKFNECAKKNIGLLTIWEDMWIHRPDACKHRIRRHLNITKPCFDKIDIIKISLEDFRSQFAMFSLDSYDRVIGNECLAIRCGDEDYVYVNYDFIVSGDGMVIRTAYPIKDISDEEYFYLLNELKKFFRLNYIIMVEDADTCSEFAMLPNNNKSIFPITVRASKGCREGYVLFYEKNELSYDIEMIGRISYKI